MKLAVMLLIGAAVAITPRLSFADAEGPASKLIPGYYDPKTNVFTPAAPSRPMADAAQPKTVKGTLVITSTVKIDPKIPPDATISAHIVALIEDPQFGGSVGRGGLPVTRSGTTGKVTVTLPFLFMHGSDSDTMNVTIDVNAEGMGVDAPFDSLEAFSLPFPKSGVNSITLPTGL